MATLIEKCIEGDRKAQYQLYQQYAKAMFNLCIRITNNHEEAEDVLQEAFLNAFRNIKQFKGESSFGAWLKRIVVNHAINSVKKKRIDLTSVEDLGKDVMMDNESDDSQIDFDINRIREAIQLLPDGYRIVFSLYLLEGYDHQEIADILHITVSASKSQYSRAKKKLRELLHT